MANKPAVARVSKASSPSTISGMDGQQMHNEILLGLPGQSLLCFFHFGNTCQCRLITCCMKPGRPLRMVTL